MHMVMMRGMHGGHDAAPRHGGNLSATDPENEARPIKLVRRSGQADANEANRIAELETQVASLQEEIDAIPLIPDPAVSLTSDECEVSAKLEEEGLEVVDERLFQIVLGVLVLEAEEFEDERITHFLVGA